MTGAEFSAILLPMPAQCDRCSALPVAVIACAEPNCGRKYARCAKHDGAAGAERSYRSHRGLYHPKELGK